MKTLSKFIWTIGVWGALTAGVAMADAAPDPRTVFENPPQSAKTGVWWHWMGCNVTREGIVKDLDWFKETGIGAATVFGMADVCTPWATKIDNSPTHGLLAFTPEWWKLLRFACEEAEKRGIELGLHNCPGYTSTGGPWIPPRLAMRELVFNVTNAEQQISLTAHAAFPVHNGDTGAFEKPQIPSRRTDLQEIAVVNGVRVQHIPMGSFTQPNQWENFGLECDKMNPEAVAFHLDHVIADLKKYVGDQVGRGLKFILLDSYEAGTPNWTPRMREEFQARRGYDPLPFLPALGGFKVAADEKAVKKFKADYSRTIKDLYRDVLFKMMHEKLAAVGLEFACEPYTGPFDSRECSAHVDRLMTEFWFTPNYNRKAPGRLGWDRWTGPGGKRHNIVEAEAFTSGPPSCNWDETPFAIKAAGDTQYTRGVNRFTLHTCPLQPWNETVKPGKVMGRWGTHFGRNQTWARTGRGLYTYFNRCQALLQWGEPSDIHITGNDITPAGTMITAYARAADGKLVFWVVNHSDHPASMNMGLPTKDKAPEWFDPATGRITPLKFENGLVPIQLAPAGSGFLVLAKPLASIVPNRDSDYVQKLPKPFNGAGIGADEFAFLGAWQVTFPKEGLPASPAVGGGTPTLPEDLVIELPELADWTKHADPRVKYFSGTATYRRKFRFTGKGSPDVLSLGACNNQVAGVKLNGRDLGTCWCAPYEIRLPEDAVRQGENLLEIEFTNVWANRLIGDEQVKSDCEFVKAPFPGGWYLKAFPNWFRDAVRAGAAQPLAGRPEKGRVCFCDWNYFDAKSKLVPSGLLGPVKLMTMAPSASASHDGKTEAALTRPVTVHFAGDSTLDDHGRRTADLPYASWGSQLEWSMAAGHRVRNLAVSGESTVSFDRSGKWKKLINGVKKGDYVVIQFGHNDQKRNSEWQQKNRWADPKTTFREIIRRWVGEVRAKGAHPLLCSPIRRATFDKDGKQLVDSSDYDRGGVSLCSYRDAMKELSEELHCDYVDMNELTRRHLEAIGREQAMKYFIISTRASRAKDGEPMLDTTHPITTGARAFAKLFLDEVRARKLSIAKLFEKGDFPITDFGAVAGGKVKNTDAFRSAFAAAEKAGGGRVVVPAGKWFTGAIHLKSNCELHLAEGAEIVFSQDPADYLPAVPTNWEGVECWNYSPLVYAYCCTNVAITGKGMLRGYEGEWKDSKWYPWVWQENGVKDARRQLYTWCSEGTPVEQRQIWQKPKANTRPQLVNFNRCRNVTWTDFKVRNSPFWTLHLFLCDGTYISGLDVYAHGNNNDGLDIDMSRNTFVENCRFNQGDDGISPKAGRNRDGWRLNHPTSGVFVRDCEFVDAHCILAIGSDISGGVRNVRVLDCTISDVINLIYVKTNRRRGGTVENIHVDGIKAGKAHSSVFGIETDILYEWKDFPDCELRTTAIRNIDVRNVECKAADRVVKIRGDAKKPVENITLVNVCAGQAEHPDLIENAKNVIRKAEVQVLAGDADWRGAAIKNWKAGATVDLAGHTLLLDDLPAAGGICSSSDGGTVRLEVAAGKTLENRAVSFFGKLRFVKAGKGVYVAAKTAQDYSGGTEIADGVFRMVGHGDGLQYGRGPVSVRSGAVFDCDGYANHVRNRFILDGGTIRSANPSRNTRGFAWFAEVELARDSRIEGDGLGFVGLGWTPVKLETHGHTLSLGTVKEGEIYLGNLTITGGGSLVASGEGRLVLGGNALDAGKFIKASGTVLEVKGANPRLAAKFGLELEFKDVIFDNPEANFSFCVEQALSGRVLPATKARASSDAVFAAVAKADDAADAAWRALPTKEAFFAHGRKLREGMIAAMGGFPQKRCPLKPVVVATIQREGYRIEKVYYESWPGVRVPANLFIPDGLKPGEKRAGIVVPCGHTGNAKGADMYQRACVVAVKAGFVVLIFDPFAQGERTFSGDACRDHNHVGALATLLGGSMARYRTWDAMRSLDYLASRPEVDSKRLGCMGQSGGGTMTSLMMSVEDRLSAACPCCYISRFTDTMLACSAGDAEQQFFGQLPLGVNYTSFVLMQSPLAVRLLTREGDFFPFAGSKKTISVAQEVAKKFGLGDHYDMVHSPGWHYWPESERVAAAEWMDRWLNGNANAIKHDVAGYQALDRGFSYAKVDDGLSEGGFSKMGRECVFPGKHARNLPGYRDFFDVLKDELAEIESARPKDRPSAETIRKIAGMGEAKGYPRREISRVRNGGVTVVREVFTKPDGFELPSVTMIPDGAKAAPAIVVTSGTRESRAEYVKALLAKGRPVTTVDLFGTGEIRGFRHRFYGNGADEEEVAVLLYALGKSLVGVQAEELGNVAVTLRQVYGAVPEVMPAGWIVISAAHAFAGYPGVLAWGGAAKVPNSWTDSVRKSEKLLFAAVVHGALRHYDWATLVVR